MKITKKIGDKYVTIEDDEIDAYAIHNWSEAKDCIKWSFYALIFFGVLFAIINWVCILLTPWIEELS